LPQCSRPRSLAPPSFSQRSPPAALELAVNPNPGPRAEAAGILARLDSPEAKEALEKLLNDGHGEVKRTSNYFHALVNRDRGQWPDFFALSREGSRISLRLEQRKHNFYEAVTVLLSQTILLAGRLQSSRNN